MITILLTVTGLAWLALEFGLIARDRVRGRGGTAEDRGTRRLNFGLIVVALVIADVLARTTGTHSPLRIPGAGPAGWPEIAGLVIVLLGLAVRVWAIVALGGSFRTTVEVDKDQAVVERGPYRLVRHPAYTGIMLIVAGLGLASGTWLGLAVCLVLPAVALLRRIQVEEAELTRVLGDPYRAYQQHTKRLIPGVW
jgi:protein-S-isoprenylcysteine O-methyltransferase Ste14